MASGAELLFARVKEATEGEYALEGELGRGGMAAVYLARDLSLQRRVAIKVMLPDLSEVEGIQDRFVTEARTSAHLDHPGIVTVYSVKQRMGLLFIVMKYIEGRTLEAVLADRRPLDVAVVASLVSQVAEALHFAHGEGIIHRDVKPSNIIIDKRGRPVVTDFGIAKVTSATSVTATGAMIGTPVYMSPEQCRGLAATAASDQYALGVMAYEMLAHRTPFQGSLFELIAAHCEEPVPPLTEIVPGIDPAVASLVMRMLAKNPRERLPSLADVASRFTRAVGDRSRTTDVRTAIADLAKLSDATLPLKRRGHIAFDLSGAATEVATTPASALVITPSEPAIEIDESLQLRVSESSGASLPNVQVLWRTEDSTVATVDATGRVTGRGAGLAKITASAGAAIGRATVTVRMPHVDTLVVTPQSPEIVADHEIQFVATALDTRGKVITGQSIVWTSADVSVCAVSQQGRAIGVTPGRTTVTALCGDVSGSALVKVRAPAVERVVIEPGDASVEVEESARLSAIVFGPFERKLVGRTVTWRSSVPAVVTVSPEGTLVGVSAGTAAVVATCEGKEGLASVRVRNQPVAAVRIQPAKLQIEKGRSIQLQGVAEDRRGRPVTERGLDWHSDDDQVALVDASGKVHAVHEGRTLVRAMSGDASSSIEVVVVPRAVAQIRIDPHAPELTVGDLLSLDAQALDAEGAGLQGRALAWSSSDPNVFAFDTTGNGQARKPGSVRITVTCEQVKATTKLSVRAPVVVPAPTPAARPPAEVALEQKAAAPTQPMPRVALPEPVPQEAAKRAATATHGRSRALPVGAALVALATLGVWMATRSTSTPSATSTTSAPAATTADSATMTIPRADSVPALVVQTPVVAAQTVAPTAQSKAPAVQQPAPTPVKTGSKSASAPTTVAKTADAKTPDTKPSDAKAPETKIVAPISSAVPLPTAPSPVRAEPAPSTPIAGDANVASVDRDRALLCGDAAVATSALGDALGDDPAARLGALYRPRDAADAKARDALLGSLKDAQRLKAAVRTIRNEPSAAGCDWVMALEFTWTNAFGQPRRRSSQLRLILEAVGGRARAKQLFGSTGL